MECVPRDAGRIPAFRVLGLIRLIDISWTLMLYSFDAATFED
jgi:hypothetical protein